MPLPGVSSEWIDGQLSQPSPEVLRSTSVLIIGTAADGPLYEPVAVRSVADAKEIFGDFGGGTLIRGIEEVYLTAGGPVDIRGLRLGGGKKAKLTIAETTATAGTLSAEQETGYAILLEAIVPGDIYNRVTIGYRDGRNIEIFNPKSGLVSTFYYDSNRDNTSADVHNVSDLVNAINADSNLNTVLTALYQSLEAHFEIKALYGNGLEGDAFGDWHASASGIYLDSTGRTHITIADRTIHWTNTSDYIDADDTSVSGVIVSNRLDNMPASGDVTSGNNISRLARVYSIADIGGNERLNVAGADRIQLSKVPVRYTGQTNRQTMTAIEDYDLDGEYFTGPSTTAAASSEFRQVYDRLFVGTGDGSTVAFRWDAPVTPDVSISLVRTAISDASNILTTSDSGYDVADDDTLTGHLIDQDGRAHDWKGQTPTTSGTFNVYWNNSTTGQPVADYSLTWDGDAATVADNGVPRGTVTFTTAPPNGTSVYVGYKSIRYNMPENSSLESATSESGSWDNWRRYFVAGQTIYFGATMPSDVEMRYEALTEYEPGTQVELVRDPFGRQSSGPVRTDTYSTVRFNDLNSQPGPGVSGLSNTVPTIIGFQYEYLPEFPDLTSFKNLSGGSDGSNLSSTQLYKELGTAYDHVQTYPVDIIVPMQATLDATKSSVNKYSGLTETVNAGFHTQLAGFLNTLTENVNETIGIIGVVSPNDTSPATIAGWVNKLVDVVPGDLTRGATVMNDFDERLVQVVAFEPVFGNDLENRIYTASGQAAYAGLISSLPPYKAVTNKNLRNTINLRFHLSRSQLERMTESRFVVANRGISNPGQYVITDNPTAAASGSDYSALSTVRIVILALDLVRAVAEPFIGEGNTPAQLLAMRTAINTGLRALMEVGALNGYDFEVISTPEMRAQHLVHVELVLVPAFEMKRIRTFVRLRAAV
jgi:hypothetical protein